MRLLKALVEKLGERATLRPFEDADHSFHAPARTGRKDLEVRVEMADALAEWIDKIPPPLDATAADPPKKQPA